MTPRPPTRVAVIGLGFGARVHVPAFRMAPDCVVTAVCGHDQTRARAAAEALDVPVWSADWRDVVARDDVDAISLALPPAVQPDVILAAAAAGKHVFCEKPVAASVDAARRACQAAESHRIVHAVNFEFPELPAWQAAARVLASGAVGAVRHFAYTWRIETYAVRMNKISWKTSSAEGGGALGNFLSHVLFNIESLLGPIAGLVPFPRPGASSVLCDCGVSLGSGVSGVVSIATDACLGVGHQLEVYGDDGALRLRNQTPDHAAGFELLVGTRQEGAYRSVDVPLPPGGGDRRTWPTSRIATRFLAAIAAGQQVSPNLRDGVRIQEWLARVGEPTGV